MAAIFKIPQFSRQPQSEYISRNYSMRRKKLCLIHEIISKTHWAASMWSYPYMFLYKALVFQAKFLDSSLSSSGYISETNDLRATKICQGMEHDMSNWDVDVESQRSKTKVMESAYMTDFWMAVSPSIFKLESQNKNRNACQTMNDTLNLTVVVLIVLVQK